MPASVTAYKVKGLFSEENDFVLLEPYEIGQNTLQETGHKSNIVEAENTEFNDIDNQPYQSNINPPEIGTFGEYSSEYRNENGIEDEIKGQSKMDDGMENNKLISEEEQNIIPSNEPIFENKKIKRKTNNKKKKHHSTQNIFQFIPKINKKKIKHVKKLLNYMIHEPTKFFTIDEKQGKIKVKKTRISIRKLINFMFVSDKFNHIKAQLKKRKSFYIELKNWIKNLPKKFSDQMSQNLQKKILLKN